MPTYTETLNLDSYQYYIDLPVNDNTYFNLRGFPSLLSYGKHPFILTFNQPENSPPLKIGTTLLFEFVDSKGLIIYTELTNVLSGGANGFTWIQKNPLRSSVEINDGTAQFQIVASLDDNSVPSEFANSYNMRSTFEFEIRKDYQNLSPIVFSTPLNLQIGSNFSESIEFDNNDLVVSRSYVNVSASNLQTNGGQVRFVELSYKESNSQANEYSTLSTYELSGSNYEVPTVDSDGLNVVSHEYKVPVPTDFRRDTPVTFRLRFKNPNDEVAQYYTGSLLNTDIEVTSSEMIFTSSATFIEGTDNLLSGSLYTGDGVGSGFEMSGKDGGAYLKSKEYTGFSNSNTGVMLFSGSVLPSATTDDYKGVGLELYGSANSFLKFRSEPSLLEIRTDKFFIGTDSTQFISGSDSNIEISSSLFHLDPKNDSLIIGADAVINANISANSIFTPAGTNAQTARAAITADGYARFVSASIGSFNINDDSLFAGTQQNPTFFISGSATGTELFISSSDFTVSATGVVSASALSLSGGDVAGLSVSDGVIEVGDILKLKSTGEITASAVSMSGHLTANSGHVGGFSITSHSLSSTNFFISGSPLVGNTDDDRYMFISSSNFNLKEDGEITASAFMMEGGTITGDVTINQSLSADSINTPSSPPYLAEINSQGFARFVSASIGSFGVNEHSLFAPSTTAVGSAPTFFISGSATSNSDFFISASKFNVKGDGEITASAAKILGNITADTINATGSGVIGGFGITPTAISSSNDLLILKSDGQITASAVSMSGTITADSGQIGGFNINETSITSSNLLMSSDGIIETSDFASGVTGWRLSAVSGSAEFQNATIRGTLATTTFEKESVNAVGGQLYVANSTVLTSSAADVTNSGSYATTDNVFYVKNASGFVIDEILSLKKTNATSFTTEYVKITSQSIDDDSSNTDFGGKLFVTRAYGAGTDADSGSLGDSPSTAQTYTEGQVIVSTGKTNTGYIRINANPTVDNTPFIDIVERTGSGLYAVDLKARLGDLSGLSTEKLHGTNPSGQFGLYSKNVFLEGGIVANTGSIGGIKMQSDKLFTGAGTYSSADTGVYLDSSGDFSLKDKFKWDSSENTLTITGSLAIADGDVSKSLAQINTTTQSLNLSVGSINSTTSSHSDRLTQIELTTGSIELSVSSINDSTSSLTDRLTAIELTTGSIELSVGSINSTTGSHSDRLTAIELTTESINLSVQSIESSTSSLNDATASIYATTQSQDSRLSEIELTTSSINLSVQAIESATSSLNDATASIYATTHSQDSRLSEIELTTSSINLSVQAIESATSSLNDATASIYATTQSQDSRLSEIELTTSSINLSVQALGVATSSLNDATGSIYATTHSQDSRLSEIELTTSSINLNLQSIVDTTSSLNDATGSIYATTQSQHDRLTQIELTTGSINLSLQSVVDTTASLFNTTASLNTTTHSQDSRLSEIELTTSSINLSLQSVVDTTASLFDTTASLNTTTHSQDSRLTEIELTTESINLSVQAIGNATSSLNDATASIYATTHSQDSRLTEIELTTESINLSVQALGSATSSLNDATASIYATTQSQDSRLTEIELTTESINLSVQALGSATSSLNDATGSIYATTQSQDSRLTEIELTTESINLSVQAIGNATSSLNDATASIYATTQSQDSRLTEIELTTESINLSVQAIGNATSSLNDATASIYATTQSQSDRLTEIELTTESINLSVQSIESTTSSLNNATASIYATTHSQDSRLSDIELTTESINLSVTAINNNTSSYFTQLSINEDGVLISGSSLQFSGSTFVFGNKGQGTAAQFISGSDGDIEISASNFHLKQGAITASSVDLSGKITADEGDIGGFNIDGHSLTTTGVEINDSTQALFISSSKFKVDHGGNVTASNVDLSGKITANEGAIGGFTIFNNQLTGSSGANIATSAAGDRIVIDGANNDIRAYEDANKFGDTYISQFGKINETYLTIDDGAGGTTQFPVNQYGLFVSGSNTAVAQNRGAVRVFSGNPFAASNQPPTVPGSKAQFASSTAGIFSQFTLRSTENNIEAGGTAIYGEAKTGRSTTGTTIGGLVGITGAVTAPNAPVSNNYQLNVWEKSAGVLGVSREVLGNDMDRQEMFGLPDGAFGLASAGDAYISGSLTVAPSYSIIGNVTGTATTASLAQSASLSSAPIADNNLSLVAVDGSGDQRLLTIPILYNQVPSSGQKMQVVSIGVGLGYGSTGIDLEEDGDLLMDGDLTVDGAFNLGTTGNSTAGKLTAANDVVAYSSSDKRFKSNITPIWDALFKVKQLNGVEFEWIPDKENHGYEGHDVGVIAQEVEKVLPEVVTTRESGFKAVKYEKMIPLLIEAIKEQNVLIEELEDRIVMLEEGIE